MNRDPVHEEQLNFLRQRAKAIEASGDKKAAVVHAHCAPHMAEIIFTMRPLLFDVVDSNKRGTGNTVSEETADAVHTLMNVACSIAGNIVASVIASIVHDQNTQRKMALRSIELFAECLMMQMKNDHGEMLHIEYDSEGKAKPFDFRQKMGGTTR